MSKVKKVFYRKVVESKSINTNSNSSITNPKMTLEKQEFHSESPYSKKFSNSRSNSNLKDSSFTITDMNSTHWQPKINSHYKIGLINSIFSKVTEKKQVEKCKVIDKRSSVSVESFSTQFKLNEIAKKHKEFGISSEILESYQKCFEEIIEKDKILGPMLYQIKYGYDDWIKSKTEVILQNNKLKAEINSCVQKYEKEIEENKRLHKKIQKLASESVEMGRNIEEKEKNLRKLQDYFLKISSIDVDEVPKDLDTWKVLILENKTYSEVCEKMKKKIKSLKAQEKELMNTCVGLRQKLNSKAFAGECKEKIKIVRRNKSSSIKISNDSHIERIKIEGTEEITNTEKNPFFVSKIETNELSDENFSGEENLII